MIAGRYTFEREIGRGGTGAVWLGRDEVLGRQVALKRIGLLPGAERIDVARADREARLSARLNHPHVVAVFDVVTDPATDDRWLVMEYVDGTTLEQMVRAAGPLAPDAAAPLLWQVSDALAAAHAGGITHRDVKPSNILVDDHGQAKLTDFGIARAATDSSLTQTGLMTGSPSYLAPEVASGGRADAAADVWSLGATAFHVLAGRPPYEIGDNVLGALYRIVNEEPPRLAGAGWMAPLLEGTMVRDPAHRWTIDQVRDFLARPDWVSVPTTTAIADPPSGRAADGHTRVVRVPPAGEPGRAATTSRRPPARVFLGLGVAAALLLTAVVSAVLLSRGAGSDDDAARRGATATSKASAGAKPTAQGMQAFIRDYVATVAADPDRAWTMLTPKFQRESGGIDRYRAFWDSATDGQVLSITANPADLTVSYHVHFEDFDNGPGPTVLDLTFDNGTYGIDGEHTKGFVPAG